MRNKIRSISTSIVLAITVIAVHAAPGDLDVTFGNGGMIPAPGGSQHNAWAAAVSVQSDQKIVVLGTDDYRIVLKRFLPDGTLDPSFGNGGRVFTALSESWQVSIGNGVELQNDGKIVVTGRLDGCGPETGAFALRYRQDGSLDPTFDKDGKVRILTGIGLGFYTTSCRLAVQNEGKIVLSCGEWMWEEDYWNVILRLNPNGSIDTTFGGGIGGRGRVYLDANELDYPNYIAFQPNGKVVAASSIDLVVGRNVVLTRLNTDGFVDASFGNSGGIYTAVSGFNVLTKALVIQPDNKIVVAGYDMSGSAGLVIRYLPDGTLDTAFGRSGVVLLPDVSSLNINSVIVQSNGKIVAGGWSASRGHLILRFLPNGDIDQTFGTNGRVATVFPNLGTEGMINGGISDLAIQADGKIIGVGNWNACAPQYPFQTYWSYQAIARFLGDFPVSDTVIIAGRVLTPTGLGLRNAVVSLTDSLGVRRTAPTSSFGMYSFTGIPAGEAYTISVTSRRFRFEPRSVTADRNLSNVDFVGLE